MELQRFLNSKDISIVNVNNKVKIIDTLYEMREIIKSGSNKIVFEKVIRPFENFEEYYRLQKELAKQTVLKDENTVKTLIVSKSIVSNKVKKNEKQISKIIKAAN